MYFCLEYHPDDDYWSCLSQRDTEEEARKELQRIRGHHFTPENKNIRLFRAEELTDHQP